MSHPSFYLNIMGVPLSEESLQKIPAPRFELSAHVAVKTSQAFGLLGCISGAVIPLLRSEQQDWNLTYQKMYEYGKIGALAGLVVGPLLTSPYLFKSTEYLWDTCYRIRFNRNLVLADRCSLLGIALGFGIAKYKKEDIKKGIFFGFIGGFTFATIGHLAIWNPINLAEKMNLI